MEILVAKNNIRMNGNGEAQGKLINYMDEW
ncbi:MAG: hypothetical protein ACI92O_002487 [Colwellia sp.]|jgi:hypothetical protein